MENIDNAIFSKSFRNQFRDPFNDYYSHLNDYPSCIDKDPVARMLYWDAISYLPDDILVKVDRASMYYSLETKHPSTKCGRSCWNIPTQ